jgi:hypothetical protein
VAAPDQFRGVGSRLDVQRVEAPADPGPADDEDQQRGDRKVTAWQSWTSSLQELHIAAGAPTIRKIAQACVRPVSHSAISDLLRGSRLPSWPVARTLIEALGADDRRRAEMFWLWKVAKAEARAERTDWSMPPPATLGPAVEDAMLYELFMIRKLVEQLVEGRATEEQPLPRPEDPDRCGARPPIRT